MTIEDDGTTTLLLTTTHGVAEPGWPEAWRGEPSDHFWAGPIQPWPRPSAYFAGAEITDDDDVVRSSRPPSAEPNHSPPPSLTRERFLQDTWDFVKLDLSSTEQFEI